MRFKKNNNNKYKSMESGDIFYLEIIYRIISLIYKPLDIYLLLFTVQSILLVTLSSRLKLNINPINVNIFKSFQMMENNIPWENI